MFILQLNAVLIYDLMSDRTEPRTLSMPTKSFAFSTSSMHAHDSGVVALLADSSSLGILWLDSTGCTVSSITVPLPGIHAPLRCTWHALVSGAVVVISQDAKKLCSLSLIDLTSGQVRCTQILDDWISWLVCIDAHHCGL